MDTELDVQIVLLLVEAAAYLALAGWALTRVTRTRWGTPLAVGAGLVGFVAGAYAVGTAESFWFGSNHVLDALFLHRWSNLTFTVLRTAGVLLLVAGVVLSRREAPRSLYGPPHDGADR